MRDGQHFSGLSARALIEGAAFDLELAADKVGPSEEDRRALMTIVYQLQAIHSRTPHGPIDESETK